MARRFVLLVVMAGAVLLVCSAVGFAAVRIGTGGDDRLMGTGDNDRITGKGGDDTTVGKAGNDIYYYANGWGKDTVIDSTGSDTLNFSAVTGGITVALCPVLGGMGAQATGSSENKVAFDSRIEKIRGSLGNDTLGGCGGKNTLSGGASDPSGPGPFAEDLLMDFDGMASELPASDDVYLGSTQQGAAAVGGGRWGRRRRRAEPRRFQLQ